MSNDEKVQAIDALLELVGWRQVYRLIPLQVRVRVLQYRHIPGHPCVMFNLREDYPPTYGPWYWKPALYDVLELTQECKS